MFLVISVPLQRLLSFLLITVCSLLLNMIKIGFILLHVLMYYYMNFNLKNCHEGAFLRGACGLHPGPVRGEYRLSRFCLRADTTALHDRVTQSTENRTCTGGSECCLFIDNGRLCQCASRVHGVSFWPSIRWPPPYCTRILGLIRFSWRWWSSQSSCRRLQRVLCISFSVSTQRAQSSAKRMSWDQWCLGN